MPLLVETGSIPKHKYLYGPEQRAHEERIAAQWRSRTQFRSQLPAVPGFREFAGQHFHTARWDYGVTGGSPDNPALAHLQGKRVGIIGTAAPVTARTPSVCATRGQRETDPEEFRMKIATGKGWQFARAENFAARLCGVEEGENLVDDGWTRFPSYKALGQRGRIVRPGTFLRMSPRCTPWTSRARRGLGLAQMRLRRKRATTEKLKAWYTGWCKRPMFRDEYPQAFNKPTVTLVNTDGCGTV
ncbi:hypothetical protein AURDEDRAFT_160117 [Auricularia subglabra TFB-10046 SS5]|nr:hypothetical protein AURDEDRAFT_160117 [Auricularia subglabra TFB-10046 SS5]